MSLHKEWATFIDPRHRIMIETAACAVGVPFVGLWLEVPLPDLEARVTARRRDATRQKSLASHKPLAIRNGTLAVSAA